MKYILFALIVGLSFIVRAQSTDPKIGDTIHAIHYSIHLDEVNTNKKTIAGFTEIKLVPVIDNLSYIPLELKDLDVDSVKVDGVGGQFTHSNEVLRILLDDNISMDDTISVSVFYGGEPFHEAWGGFHFSGDYAFNLGVGFESIPHNLGKTWFPCVDDFTDRATYEFFITAENGKKAICGGILQDTIDNENGTKTWHWELNHNIPTYLASVAVGEYLLFDDVFFGMQDTIPINIFTRPSDIGRVAGSFVNLKQILQWFEEKFGPYPFGRVGYTGTAIGAMEHASNIAYPHFAINGNTSYEDLYTHELSHMWFGDKVTCSSAEDMWLNEGWASFCDIFYQEDLYGYDQFIKTMRHEHREVLRTTHKIDDGYYALNAIPQEYTYGSHAYDKGATVTNTLRGYLGDSLFYDVMSAYLNHHAWQSVSSYDMRDFITDYTGIDMTGFFDAWVFTPGTPHFSIDSTKVTEGDASFLVDIYFKQKFKGADFLGNDNVLEVTFVDENFNFQSDTIHFSGETGHSVKYVPFHPEAVFLDLFEKINDATTDNYQFFSEPETYSFPDTYFALIIDQLADSALVRTTHSWVATDSLKKPVDGLRLSPYRHWKIEGVFPDSMKAKGRFSYDRGKYLDEDLILSDSDSVVILYREHPSDDWQEVSQVRFGNWNIGYITVDDLRVGEYTLAVWDKYLVGTNPTLTDTEIKIYPNPSHGELNFEFQEKGKYSISLYDSKGVLIDQLEIIGRKKHWKWQNNQVYTGVVFVHITEGKKLLTIRKLIITN